MGDLTAAPSSWWLRRPAHCNFDNYTKVLGFREYQLVAQSWATKLVNDGLCQIMQDLAHFGSPICEPLNPGHEVLY